MKRIVAGVLVAGLVLACRPAEDPERKRLLNRLHDVRPEARIAAMHALAEGANREEAAAIARAAQGAPAQVRREAAAALGRARDRSAVDLLGAMLRDSSDSTRAAAVTALAGRSDPKVKGYLVAAYVDGGPRTRAAVAEGAPGLLSDAVQGEARAREEWARRAINEGVGAVRADGLTSLGIEGSAKSLAELVSRSSSDDEAMARTAAGVLSRVAGPAQIPELERLAGSARPSVALAAWAGLVRLGVPGADARLAERVILDTAAEADAILDVLWDTELSPEARTHLCEAARRRTESRLAVDAYRLSGPACDPSAWPEPEAAEVEARWRVLARAGLKVPALLSQAREAIGGEDVGRALAAMAYLSAVGGPAEAATLAKLAASEHDALVSHRVAIRRQAASERASRQARDEAWRRQLADMLFDGEEEKLDALPRQLENKLSQYLLASSAQEELPEHRPGGVELISAAAAMAARMGSAQAPALGEKLLDDEDPRLRQAAVEIAFRTGDAGESLRAKLRVDADPQVVFATLVRDLAAGRQEAADALARMAEASEDPLLRSEVATALAPRAADHRDLLLRIARGQDASAAVALGALADVPGDEVTEAIATRIEDVRSFGALEAVRALPAREGASAGATLLRAAVHPEGPVRAAALTALTGHRACRQAVGLARALTHDYEASVRRAAERMLSACAPASAGR